MGVCFFLGGRKNERKKQQAERNLEGKKIESRKDLGDTKMSCFSCCAFIFKRFNSRGFVCNDVIVNCGVRAIIPVSVCFFVDSVSTGSK